MVKMGRTSWATWCRPMGSPEKNATTRRLKLVFHVEGLSGKRNLRIAAGEPLPLPPVFPLHIASIFWLCLGGPSGDLGRGNPSPAPWGSSRTSKPVSVLLPARARTHACLGRKLPQPHIFFSRKIQPGFSVEIPDVC